MEHRVDPFQRSRTTRVPEHHPMGRSWRGHHHREAGRACEQGVAVSVQAESVCEFFSTAERKPSPPLPHAYTNRRRYTASCARFRFDTSTVVSWTRTPVPGVSPLRFAPPLAERVIAHPFLRRDSSREDIISFKRRVPPRPSQAKRRMSIPEEVVSPISDSSASFDSPPEGFTRSSYIESDDETRPMPMAFPTLYPVRVMTPPPLIEHGQLGSPFVAESVKEQHDSDTINDPAQIFRFNLDPNHSGVPQTAPAGANVFGMPIRIHQDSFRTRSVQGEPPSATLFSPTSPLAQESWLPEMEMSEGMVKAEPTDGENGTWMRRVYTNMPRYQTSSLPVSPPEYVMRRPTHHTSNSLQFIPTSYTAAIVEVASTTPTVSPGIFQTGFSFPPPNQASPRPHTMPLTSSRPVSSNDSPHSVPGYFAPLHTDIELDGQGQGQGQGEVGPDVPMTTAMEDSLPSASLPGFHHSGPFDQVLRDDTVV